MVEQSHGWLFAVEELDPMMCLGWKPQLSCYPENSCGKSGLLFLVAAAVALFTGKKKGGK